MNAIIAILAVVIGGANIGFWFFVIRREDRFRRYVERTLGVVITLGRGRRGWRVDSEGGSWLRNRGIEGLQLGYYLAAYLVWGLFMLLLYGLGALVERGR